MYDHLASIDAEAWPGVASVPSSRRARHSARRVEAEFAQACAKAGIELEGEDPDITVLHDALFARIADSGWLGLGESYLAGEWTTPDSDRLVTVLQRLLGVGYKPKDKELPVEDSTPGELPMDLVKLYAGDSLSHSGGIFASGVPLSLIHI